MTGKVITRFAPSPTGLLHVGGIRTALFSWLYARRHGGKFLLRIEDTDRERSTQEALNVILEGMAWLELQHDRPDRDDVAGVDDRGIVYQSKRTQLYKDAIQRLLERDRAYYCYCTREELDAMRKEAMSRGRNPGITGSTGTWTGGLRRARRRWCGSKTPWTATWSSTTPSRARW